MASLFPLGMVTVLVSFSYIVFVVGLCIFQLLAHCEGGFFSGCFSHGYGREDSYFRGNDTFDDSDDTVIFLRAIHAGAYLVIYHFLLVMFVTCYAFTVFLKSGNIPMDFYDHWRGWEEENEIKSKPVVDQEPKTSETKEGDDPYRRPDPDSMSPTMVNEGDPNSPSYCRKCERLRPPRAHHCKWMHSIRYLYHSSTHSTR